ncbi:hypothetical protein GUY60_04775 [Streptomyces sp. YC537]|uniref:Fe2OG dioxygenase domain-containing protein n=1 Tax=Streptomyces boluensis TaxID=1775135 RepID=A0A964XIZ1_9ACTN|nr:hypothetical protein [Streptomyces boluensis]
MVFRGAVPAAVCSTIAERFRTSPGRRVRGADAPGHYLGAYHYHKTTAGYLDESAAHRAELDRVLDVPGDPLTLIRSELGRVLAEDGVTFRPARHAGREAGAALIRSWHGRGEFALAPHEDQAQCTEPRQADFEIQQVVGRPIGAMNVCLENGRGGRLRIWDTRPDDATRDRLGLTYTGSPYPLASLDGVETCHLDIGPGDIYFFNGAHVHAVEPERDATARRTTLSGMLGFIDERTVVSWT